MYPDRKGNEKQGTRKTKELHLFIILGKKRHPS